MWYDEGVREYSDMTKKINTKYCNLHKYDFIYDNIRILPDRKAQWECIPLIQKILNDPYDAPGVLNDGKNTSEYTWLFSHFVVCETPF